MMRECVAQSNGGVALRGNLRAKGVLVADAVSEFERDVRCRTAEANIVVD